MERRPDTTYGQAGYYGMGGVMVCWVIMLLGHYVIEHVIMGCCNSMGWGSYYEMQGYYVMGWVIMGWELVIMGCCHYCIRGWLLWDGMC